MSAAGSPVGGARPVGDRRVLAAGAAIVAAVAAAYSRTLGVPFLFDDKASIVDNPSIRHLGTALFPPIDATVGGRPVLNFSLAANYALGGLSVGGYHAFNIAVHAAAALVLFGILRRTLRGLSKPWADQAAFAAALVWAVHPLDSNAVTYVIQRAESLMGLFFLVTIYGLLRGALTGGAGARRGWYGVSFASCLLGMGTKEVMVVAPVVALLFDRTFLAGTFKGALRARRGLYLLMAATWVPFAFLVVGSHGRGGSAGLGSGVSPLDYAATQLPAIVRYLRLTIWPRPFIFDYGTAIARPSAGMAGAALAVGLLLAATLWALARRPAAGFLGAAFFLILAPSSSLVPIATETVAEHRMYLPLIAVVVALVVVLFQYGGRAAGFISAALAIALLGVTAARNEVYRTADRLWSATVDADPLNDRARSNLGDVLEEEGREQEALVQRREAVRLAPASAKTHDNLGKTLARIPGRTDEAIGEFLEALRLDPGLAEAESNLGNALDAAGRTPEAIAHLENAVRLRPEFAAAHNNLGVALEKVPGRMAEAIVQYRDAIRISPDYAAAHNNLGSALARRPGGMAEAAEEFTEAARLDPGYSAARFNLGSALLAEGRPADASAQFAAAIRLNPAVAAFHVGYAAAVLNQGGSRGDALAALREALRLDPGNQAARRLLAQLGEPAP